MPFHGPQVWALSIATTSLVAVFGAVSAVVPERVEQKYHVNVWKTDDGLPQSSITAITQTRDGYLWLGTFGGMARFDGVRFKTLDVNQTGISNRRTLSLFQSRSGALWAGTEEGELLRFEGTKAAAYNPPSLGTASKYVRAFAETPDGTLWLNTAEGQLIRLVGQQFTVVSIRSNLQGRVVNSIWTDPAGRLWIGTDAELARWAEGVFEPVWNRTREPGFSVDAMVGSIRGGLWIAGGGRVRRFDTNQWVADYGEYPWSKGVLTCLHEDRQGQLWVGTYGSGLFRYRSEGALLQLSRNETLPGNFVRSLFEDREGNIWVGTEGRGLARLKPSIFQSFTRGNGLSSDLVMSVCEGEEGELWIGTNGEGINRLKDGVVRHYGPSQGLTNECVWSVLVDQQKRVWAGTWGGGLFRLTGDTFEPVTDPIACAPVVCALFEDSKARLWLGQLWNQRGITRFTDGKATVFELPTKLSQTDVRVMTEDGEGNIWIGTRGDGLYRFKDEQCTRFTRQDGLSSEFVLSLYADGEGALWVGTRDGLNRLQNGRFTTYTTREGLIDNTICHITEDEQGHLWFGSSSGVFRARKEELQRYARGETLRVHCLGYTKADGLPSLECTSGCQPAGCKTGDGKLWFPTMNGLAVVDPRNVPVNPLAPPVIIEEVLIEEKNQSRMVDVSADSAKAEPLKVGPGKPRFEFRYAGLSFTAPEKVRFKYKLEPLEENWVEAGTRRTALYSYLQPGHYRFRVLACNNDGVWNEAGATLAMVLLPHFWQTWWFRGVVALAIIALFIGIYEIRLAAERRLTRLRLRIARDLHDEVGSNLGSIALLSEVSQRGTRSEEMSEIRRVAIQTIESLRDIVWFLDPASDNMSELALRMKETARTMLPGISFDFRAEGELDGARPSLELRRNLFPMFKEMLHNVAKHAKATQVEIEVENSARGFRFSVADNGIGFVENEVRAGNGLKNLRRRGADLGGTVEIESHPGRGTTVRVSTPIT